METKFNFNSQICTSKVQSERIALVDIFAKMKGLKEALLMYQSWFENTK